MFGRHATHHVYVVEPFCPTNENVPFANQRSFASFTRWAAARFVSSNPCTGVTTSDDAVPDVCAELAARASVVVRSRFAFDILAALSDINASANQNQNQRQIHLPRLFDSPTLARTFPVPTPIMPRPFVSSNAPTSSSASPNAIRFVSFRSSVCAYASLALRALNSELARQKLKLAGNWQKEVKNVPSAATALLWAIVRYGQCLHNLGWRGRGQPIKVFLDLFSKLGPITTYTREGVSSHARLRW